MKGLVYLVPKCLPQYCYPIFMRRVYWFCLFGIFPCLSLAESDCYSLAKTAMELTYCKIAATPEASNLPSFSDFRRNTSQVQAMVLKAPARRLGIELPNSGATRKTETAASNPKTPSSSSTPVKSEPKKKTQAPTKTNAVVTASKPKASPGNLAGCQLQGRVIHCGGRNYQLVDNRQNRDLASGVLGPDNNLLLPSFQGSVNDQTALNNYLADSYELYVNKMLLIGLGGSTMTYTKFHYTFMELREKGEDFAGRVRDMYNYLKQDKAGMVVKARYDQELPGGIDWCQALNSNLIVCDDGKKNWVYAQGLD